MSAVPSGNVPRPASTELSRPEAVAADPADALSPAKPAVGTGASPLVAQLFALALVALGAVGVQEALVRWGWISSPSWTSAVLDALDGVEGSSALVLVVGVVAIVLGLLLLAVALRRRPRRGVQVGATTNVDLRTRDVESMARVLLDGPGAVTDARVRASRRRVVVKAVSGADDDQLGAVRDDVRERLRPLLAALEHTPRLKVSVKRRSQ